jgi:hypothetical protein
VYGEAERPGGLDVFLMTSSNLLDCTTDSPVVLAPLKDAAGIASVGGARVAQNRVTLITAMPFSKTD